jgi:hypothetical protein
MDQDHSSRFRGLIRAGLTDTRQPSLSNCSRFICSGPNASDGLLRRDLPEISTSGPSFKAISFSGYLALGLSSFDCRADNLYAFSAMRESRPRNEAPYFTYARISLITRAGSTPLSRSLSPLWL